MTYKTLPCFLNCLLLLTGIVVSLAASSCNSKEDEPTSDNYITTESVAVTGFSLMADIRVMKNLDSVYFSIDLEHGVIFNADSLPKGTNITKLIPRITYPNTVSSATIEMTGGSHREGTVNYRTSSTDTIDFTGDVKLILGANNNSITKTYTLKVNVHKEDPDTIYWDRLAETTLPSRMPSPLAQKTVEHAEKVISLIRETDGSLTVSTTHDIFTGEWTKSEVTPPFSPEIESLTAGADGRLYILGDGSLWTTADGISWTIAASGWQGIIGAYGNSILGRKGDMMTCYPEGTVESMKLPDNFPVEGYTSPIEFNNRWSSDPVVVIFGGKTADGSLSSASWAFDGSVWANIADKALPAMEGFSVAGYYSYLNSSTNGLLKEFEAYLAFGGRDSTGNLNRSVYITYDNGINWQKAQGYMQMPDDMTAGYMVDALALGTSMQSNLDDRWNSRRRLPFEVTDGFIKWDCPYLFLFGGYDGAMSLNTKIRSGVLQRLTFVPLF